MFGNDQEVIIQSSGYNGSEPTRICPIVELRNR